ncbi:helix-turn-helix transcriptional regulator [Nocardia sp. NPDC051981]|uniref:helix-turn-helix domain-containing protein n=1 Tax=Nocardia sp. NPDC051981 TaxID=3155417 RepID=UPI0034366912
MSEEVSQSPGEEPLPVLPGFREMALRKMSEDRARLIAELVERRRAAGLSQIEVAARMGTSQSAVARLETENVDVRTSTLQRYAAAVDSRITLQVTSTTAESNRIGEQP